VPNVCLLSSDGIKLADTDTDDRNVLIVETISLLLNILPHLFVKLPNEAFINEVKDGIIFPVTVILEFGLPKSAVKLIENKYRNQKSIRQQNVIKSYFVTVSIDVRTIWYNKKSPIMIDDANAAKLTNLYINKYNSNMFSLYKDPKNYYTENNEAIPYKKIVQGMNGQFIENNEYSRTYQTNNYYELQTLVKDNIIKEFNMNDQYKRIDVI
jgi:hypothetical protein